MYKTAARQVTALVTKVYDLNIWSVHAIGYVEIGAAKLAVGSCYWTEVDAYLPIIYPATRPGIHLSNDTEYLLLDF